MSNITEREIRMKIWSVCVLGILLCPAISACTPEHQPPAATTREQSVLSQADREKVLDVVKELQSVNGLSDKLFELLGKEVKVLATGERTSVDLGALLEKAKNELLTAGAGIKCKVPAGGTSSRDQAESAGSKRGNG